ncbi:unnamed protein product [Eretmochelys imbricata]
MRLQLVQEQTLMVRLIPIQDEHSPPNSPSSKQSGKSDLPEGTTGKAGAAVSPEQRGAGSPLTSSSSHLRSSQWPACRARLWISTQHTRCCLPRSLRQDGNVPFLHQWFHHFSTQAPEKHPFLTQRFIIIDSRNHRAGRDLERYLVQPSALTAGLSII